ncbi:MAG TPA: PIN domain-containing protein, partial [Pirellulales bacterium]|nr:PIN domain-containing protein [Pirellulales bacterium]
MAMVIQPNDEVFLDTSYAVALSAETDKFHVRALSVADELERLQTRVITTRAVFMEIGNSLARRRYRAAAIRLLAALERDRRIEVVPLSDEL